MSEKQPYIVSARKYRPATFKTVVGQRALTATLKNAISGGRLAQAYLFCGPRGVGKTSCARIFAKTINCMNRTADGEACGVCDSCLAIDKGNSFNIVELDAASNNSVDDIRNITDQVYVPAQQGQYRVFIIDEVHMLSNAAFNAFLKTLEEPPRNVVFILATTERHKVIPTILSRCQVYDFRRITVNDIIDHLEYVGTQEGVKTEREALGVIALKADGAMRDALSIFDQVVASTQGNVNYQSTIEALNVLDQDYYFRLVDTFRNGDVPAALLTLKEITDKGFDAQFFVNGLASHVRNLMVAADARTMSLLETSEEMSKKYSAQAPSLPVEWYYSAIKILNDCDFNYRTASNKRLLVELALIRLSRLLLPKETQTMQAPQPQVPSSQSPQVQNGKSTAPQPPVSQSAPLHSGSDRSQMSQQPGQPSNPAQPPFVNPAEQPQVRQAGGYNSVARGGVKKPTSFRLSDSGQPAISKNPDEKRKNLFSQEQLLASWKEYIETHPEQRILISAMRVSSPQHIKDLEYKVTVEHPAQRQAFDSSMPELLNYLRDRLSNDFISLLVEISDKQESERLLSPRDFLKKTLEQNPGLASFLNDLEAELE